MRLWQKVFLAALTLTILAVDAVALVVLQNNFEATISREEQQAVVRHNSFSAAISNQVVYQRLHENTLMLTEEEVDALLRSVLQAGTDADMGIAVYRDEALAVSSYGEVIDAKPDFRAQMQADVGCLTTITDFEGKSYLLVGSPLTLENMSFSIYTATDISVLYENYEQQLRFVQRVGVLESIGIALVLLGLVLWLMLPLSRVNRAIREIAKGEYEKRLSVHGKNEVAELSESVNRMAQAIGENLERVQNIADSRKTFIDNFAHEMKTPLTSILGFADILRIKRTVAPKERMEYAGIIVEEAKRLRGLSGKLLELATADNVELDCVTLSIAELFETVGRSVIPVLQKSELSLQVHTPDVTAFLDPELMKSLLYNLVDNAAKASAPGQEIRMLCEVQPDRLIFSVSDDGCGMEPSQILRVTEPFYMVDKSRSRKAGGAGLGLSLCERIARCHGGKLWIQSAPGIGTTVFASVAREEGTRHADS